jgi:hypothetical protein
MLIASYSGGTIKGKSLGEGIRADEEACRSDSSERARITEWERRFGIWAG